MVDAQGQPMKNDKGKPKKERVDGLTSADQIQPAEGSPLSR